MEHFNDFRIPDEAFEKIKDPIHLKKQVDEGKTFQEILGYSFETMEKFYEAAHHLFQKQQYEEASDAFVFLTTLNPNVHNYWLGLGMSEQLIEEYDAALMAYSMAVMTNGDNPLPHYHSASCYSALHDKNSAKLALELAVKQAGDHVAYASIKSHAQQALARIQDS